MPRNAAKKLINDEVCLPIQTTKTATETIILISPESDIQQTNTPTENTTTQQKQSSEQTESEQKQQQEQLQQEEVKNRRQRKKRRGRQRSKKRITSKASTSSDSAKPIAETSDETANKKPTNTRKYASRKRYSPPYFPTLYPIVIETYREEDLQSVSASGKSCTATASGTNAALASSAVGVPQTPLTPIGAGGRRQLRRRRSISNFTKRKNRAKAKAVAAAAAVAAVATVTSSAAKIQVKSKETVERLATLRNRKQLQERVKEKQSKESSAGRSDSDLLVKRHTGENIQKKLKLKIKPKTNMEA